jgi:hypothetical protein
MKQGHRAAVQEVPIVLASPRYQQGINGPTLSFAITSANAKIAIGFKW